MFVIPKKGLRVMDPSNMSVVPEAGKKVSGHSTYWIRQARAGDVQIFEKKPEAKKPKAPKGDK